MSCPNNCERRERAERIERYSDGCERGEREERRYCRRHPEPGEALLSCGSGGVGPLPIINTVLSRPLPVVSTSLDTTRMCSPRVLLTFTGQINLPLGISVTLNFVITKSCEGGYSQELGTYTFSTLATILEAEAFSFQYCDCGSCPGCCTYSVEISTNSIIDIVPGLTVTNATLSALAVECK